MTNFIFLTFFPLFLSFSLVFFSHGEVIIICGFFFKVSTREEGNEKEKKRSEARNGGSVMKTKDTASRRTVIKEVLYRYSWLHMTQDKGKTYPPGGVITVKGIKNYLSLQQLFG